MAEIEAGSLYDFNKDLVRKNINALVEEQLEEKWNLAYKFFNRNFEEEGVKYFMLLCKERSDYTIFAYTLQEKFEDGDCICDYAINATSEATSILIDECLKNRGEIRSIEETEEGNIEIWLYFPEEDNVAVYYLFPYGDGVIEV